MSDYYIIGEVADLLGLPEHTLRYWETEFKILHPVKRNGGRRYYSEEDIEVIKIIRTILHEKGYSIEEAKEIFNYNKNYFMAKKTSGRKQSEQIDIFDIISKPTAEEKAALIKVLGNLRQMQSMLKSPA